MSQWLGAPAEAEGCFLGGVLVPSVAALRDVLGLDGDLLAEHGPGSKPVAEAMASAVRARFAASCGLAVGKAPKFDPHVEAQPLWMALAAADGIHTREMPCGGHPAILRTWAAKQALNLVRLRLLE